jgi:hypothetical protein
VAVIKRAIVAFVSAYTKEIIIGIRVNIPVICIINPIFERIDFI